MHLNYSVKESAVKENLVKENVVKESTKENHYNRIAMTLEYIEDNIDKKISVSNLTNVALMSPYHFQRVFRDHTGYSVREYIRNKLLERAADFLITTECNVKQLQKITHYNSAEAFSRAFKSKFGVTPVQFREQNKKYTLQ